MASSRPVAWSLEARADLLQIWAYYREEAGEHIAEKMIREIVGKAVLLEQHPFAGRARNELRRGMRSVLSGPYVIFYRAGDGESQIVRVLHGRRDMDEIFAK